MLPENRHSPKHKVILFLLTRVTYSFLFLYENKPFLKYYGFFFEYVNCYFNRSLLKHLQRNLCHTFLKLFIYAVLFLYQETTDTVNSLFLKKMSDESLYCYILPQTEFLESFRMVYDFVNYHEILSYIYIYIFFSEQILLTVSHSNPGWHLWHK